ncbi:hypothetical protein EUX98_g6958 [Antrodiella citrinella]|uniref:Peptidase A1 domain-containing protein n=1 Tax=Antrodiella citrinella TaxID=2447956 RepID=A0A4S4MMW2_9APHY|nr:hypothetical protein EUX98_g6958 [Antrodiella citrinella]
MSPYPKSDPRWKGKARAEVLPRDGGQGACGGLNHKYDPTLATQTGRNFEITYVEGEVTGPIVWDTVQIGDYVINNQALAAATTVVDEPLSNDFNGVLGLALPLNSFIAEQITPTTSNQPDGAPLGSNLFGTTPSDDAPASRFFSLTLERPESNEIPSQLCIGKHPTLVTDPSTVQYDDIVSESSGAYYWKAELKGITVYQNNTVKPIALSAGTGAATPTAILDSGMPIILASLSIANGIYGALGIGPASDGQYYVPCDLPMNLTVTLDNRTEIALHPLDLTTASINPSSSEPACMGVIQSFPAGSSVSELADIVLGVPFLRSTYTVLAYDAPDEHGVFPSGSSPAISPYIRPHLGLLGLTNSTTALDEFNTVRVLNQPLSQPQSGSNSPGAAAQTSTGGKKLSVGIEVLIGLLGFFVLCIVLFFARWGYGKRKIAAENAAATAAGLGDKKDNDVALQEVAFRLARRSSRSDPYAPSDDIFRESMRFSQYRRTYTDETDKTRVNLDREDGFVGSLGKKTNRFSDHDEDDFAYIARKKHQSGDVGVDYALLPVDTHDSADDVLDVKATLHSPDAYPLHHRTQSGGPNVAAPLLTHRHSHTHSQSSGDEETTSLSRSSMRETDIASPHYTRPSSPSPLVASVSYLPTTVPAHPPIHPPLLGEDLASPLDTDVGVAS